MIRSQIYLTETERKKLRQLSSSTGKSQSELIREAIDEFLDKNALNKQNKLHVLRSVKGLWSGRNDLPDFTLLRQEFDRDQKN